MLNQENDSKPRILNEKNIIGSEICINQTPKEEILEFYPFEDIYPSSIFSKSHRCEPEHNLDNKDNKYFGIYKIKEIYRLPYAIYYLQKDRVKYLLDVEKLDCGNILFNIYDNDGGYKYNCLEILCCQVRGYYCYNNNSKKVCDIAKLLCENNPKLITSKAFEMANFHKYNDLVDLMASYVNDEKDDKCYICMCSEPKTELLMNLCECKSKIHVRCAEKLINESKDDKCKVCTKLYKYSHFKTMFRLIMYYPCDDFYPNPIMTSYPIKKIDKMNDKIYYAMQFLQVKRFDELLKNLTKDEIYNFFFSKSFRTLYKYFTEYGNMPTNYFRNKHKEKYDQIEEIINKYIDISQLAKQKLVNESIKEKIKK